MPLEHRALLASETDFGGFREQARALLRAGATPESIAWSVQGRSEADLLSHDDAAFLPLPPGGAGRGEGVSAPHVPPDFIALCEEVTLHQDPTRFDLLYTLLWRLQQEPGLRHDAADPQMHQARRMAQAVRRDMHKMKAFVRFREVARGDGEQPLHVAWFEPEHHIVEAVAPFFVRRFAGMCFAILTPERCLQWDGHEMQLRPGASKQDAPAADAGEALWLTYYEHIFNPARLKLRMMEKEMPRRYWHNLPEATLISQLAAQAHERSAGMVERAPTLPARKRPAMATARVVPIAAGPAEDAMRVQREAAAGCRECPLGALATQTVWGEGPVPAPLMLVGEQPGDQEDLQGQPFVGPAGKLLSRAMAELGWDRSVAYITNAVKHFKYEPRGRRRIHKTPAQREADACLHWLEAEITLVQPRGIVALGATAARQLLGRPVAVTRERGQWLPRADGLPVLVTLHPSALLRMEDDVRDAAFEAWLHDLKRASHYLEAA